MPVGWACSPSSFLLTGHLRSQDSHSRTSHPSSPGSSLWSGAPPPPGPRELPTSPSLPRPGPVPCPLCPQPDSGIPTPVQLLEPTRAHPSPPPHTRRACGGGPCSREGKSPGMSPRPTLANPSALKPGIFPEERRKCLWWSMFLNAYFMFGGVFKFLFWFSLTNIEDKTGPGKSW